MVSKIAAFLTALFLWLGRREENRDKIERKELERKFKQTRQKIYELEEEGDPRKRYDLRLLYGELQQFRQKLRDLPDRDSSTD